MVVINILSLNLHKFQCYSPIANNYHSASFWKLTFQLLHALCVTDANDARMFSNDVGSSSCADTQFLVKICVACLSNNNVLWNNKHQKIMKHKNILKFAKHAFDVQQYI